MEPEDYKNEIEMLRQAFADGKTDEQIQMPDTETELTAFVARHRNQFEHRAVRLTFMRQIAALFMGIVLLSGLTYAAVRTSFFTQPWSGDAQHAQEPVADATPTPATAQPGNQKPLTERVEATDAVPTALLIVPNDTVQKPQGTVTFDNHELADILTSICNAYRVEIQFRNEEQKHIRLHFSYDTKDKLVDVMESLNTFQKFRLELKDNKLTVE